MVKQAEKIRRKSSLLPAMGLVLAVCVAVIAYFAAPLLVELLRENVGAFNARVGNPAEIVDTPAGAITRLRLIELGMVVVLWLALYGLSMIVVTSALGEDPEDEERLMRPRENASEKEWERYRKRYAKLEQRRIRQAEEKQKREEQARRRR
jgi:hypothetical protein